MVYDPYVLCTFLFNQNIGKNKQVGMVERGSHIETMKKGPYSSMLFNVDSKEK